MAQNVMRVDSMNDRYVTETMIDLNLNLNEEIDFDFFDNVQSPSKKLLAKAKERGSNLELRPSSPQSTEDDDDVQISPQQISQNFTGNRTASHTCVKSANDSSLSDTNEELTFAAKECGGKLNGNFEVPDNLQGFVVQDTDLEMTASCQAKTDIKTLPVQKLKEFKESSFLHHGTLYNGPIPVEIFDSDDKDLSTRKLDENCDHNILCDNSKKSQNETASSCKSSETHHKDTLSSKSNKSCEAGVLSSNSSERHREDASSIKSSEDCDANVQLNKLDKNHGKYIFDSDEGFPFDGSDEELLLGVHTLTIIPKENDDKSCSHQEDTDNMKDGEIVHLATCERTNPTARSSSGYSSASCKTHGYTYLKQSTNSKTDNRQSSSIKSNSPDIDEFIKSFGKINSTSPAVSFGTPFKHTSSNVPGKRPRKNMSFSNEEMQRIERENAILLNKIVLQQRTRPNFVHKYERRVTSNAINRARQLKKIENDNEILLRKIQDVKRKGTLSGQSSRCISQASTSQC